MKKLFITGILTFLLTTPFLVAGILYAQRVPEVTYPTIVPGVIPPTGQTNIAGYLRYLYTSAIALGGIICLGALIWGGLRFLTSAGNPAAMADARERILYGIIGLFILLGSFVLLREINPQLITFTPPLMEAAGEGIIVYSDRNCGEGSNGFPGVLRPLPPDVRYERVFDIKRLANESISIQSVWTFEDDEDILIEFYQNTNCEGNPHRRIPAPNFNANTCIQNFGIIQNIQCIKIIRHTPGVHLFTEEGARIGQTLTGQHHIFVNSVGSFPQGLDGNVHTLALVENTQKNILYGAILHLHPGAVNEEKGWSSIWLPSPYLNTSAPSTVESIGPFQVTYYDNPHYDTASSLTVFKVLAETGEERWIQICVNNNCVPRPGCPGIIRIFPWSGRWMRANYNADGTIDWEEGNIPATTTISYLPEEIVRGINVFEITDDDRFWCDPDNQNNTDPIQIQDGHAVAPTVDIGEVFPHGISAIEIQPGAQYIVILNDRRDAVTGSRAATHNPSLVTAASIDALQEVGFDNAIGSIIIIKGEIQ